MPPSAIRLESCSGIQFHPEVAHTPRGAEMLRAFLFDIAGLEPDWTPGSFVDEAIASVVAKVGAR